MRSTPRGHQWLSTRLRFTNPSVFFQGTFSITFSLQPINKWGQSQDSIAFQMSSFWRRWPMQQTANMVPKPHSRDPAHSLPQIYSYSRGSGSFLACVQDAQIWEDKREFTLLLCVHLKASVLKFLILEFWGFTVREKS